MTDDIIQWFFDTRYSWIKNQKLSGRSADVIIFLTKVGSPVSRWFLWSTDSPLHLTHCRKCLKFHYFNESWIFSHSWVDTKSLKFLIWMTNFSPFCKFFSCRISSIHTGMFCLVHKLLTLSSKFTSKFKPDQTDSLASIVWSRMTTNVAFRKAEQCWERRVWGFTVSKFSTFLRF